MRQPSLLAVFQLASRTLKRLANSRRVLTRRGVCPRLGLPSSGYLDPGSFVRPSGYVDPGRFPSGLLATSLQAVFLSSLLEIWTQAVFPGLLDMSIQAVFPQAFWLRRSMARLDPRRGAWKHARGC